MNPTTTSPRPFFLRWRTLAVVAVLVVGSGLVAFYAGTRLNPSTPEPPTVPLEGVEKPVADAITAARERVREQPHSAEAWGLLGKLLLTHRFPSQAEQCFAQAEQLDDKQPRWPYYRGLTHLHQDNALALAHLRRAVELGDRYEPNVSTIRLRLAEALLEQGLDEEAEAELRTVFAKDPNNPWLLYHRGLRALARDDLGAAIERLTPLTNHPSARQKACVQLAMICRRQGNADQAAEFTRRAAELPEDQPWPDPYVDEYRKLQRDAQGRLLQVKALEAQGKYQEVMAELNSINESSESDLASLAVGINLAKLRQYDQAEKALRDTLARYPDKVQAHYFLALVLFIQGDQVPGRENGVPEAARAKYRGAAEEARRTLQLKPDHGLAHVYLGRSLLLLGQKDEGLKELRAAVACKPEEARAHFFLGEALADTGQVEEAVHHLELAARLVGKDDPLPAAAALQGVREKLGKPK
jgi:tetratricopeptide (TPR) repeat protein